MKIPNWRAGVLACAAACRPELAHWQDTAGRRVPGPPRPDEDWLRSHRWVWSRSALEQILAGSGQAVFVCGIARNQDELLGRFDRVFLLRIDAGTQEARLAAHDAARPPGRSEAARQEIRQGRVMFEAQMIEAGAIALDGTAPTASVAGELLTLAAATWPGAGTWRDAPCGTPTAGSARVRCQFPCHDRRIRLASSFG